MLTNINVQFYIAAYLIGAIPFGLILARSFAGVNIKKRGAKVLERPMSFAWSKRAIQP